MSFPRKNFRRFYRETTIKQKASRNERLSGRKRRNLFLMVLVPVLVSLGIATNALLLNLGDLGLGGTDNSYATSPLLSIPVSRPWCETVREARDGLSLQKLHVSYPCEGLKPAVSAIVCMLTDGATTEKANRIVFSARDYINGAMSLGASLEGRIDPSRTHMLLLLRQGFELERDDLVRLESVGWTIGTAPDFPLPKKYLPRFPRYKTTYTKVSAIGLSEYECVMLMDADTLAVGDLTDVMECGTVFRHPNNRVAGTIDWYRMGWKLFNTGSILWKTDAREMERVFNLTEDPSFMKRYGSDQDFLNNVYPDRLHNTTLNEEIVALDNAEARSAAAASGSKLSPVVPHGPASAGAVVPLSWDYNAQTHAEVQNPGFWTSHRPTAKILHFTEKKGWQCERTTEEPVPPEKMPEKCKKELPICFCREAHLYWRALERAEALAATALAAAGGGAR
ncbi:unnamed protein product [Pseudo-nitzschia multistriata]|uniref:Nucleotide-diphospho-sugar transferase domain-containing protein n=1 Tax=Pseudo-nitzschia multistriata TaxID=183589 RepID=A0A448ZC97_9STRA|nr:unnamed protein product [Pseudo-nitzschia multistriata]